MKLSILIPTYNRCQDLKKNLDMLSRYIIHDGLETEVCILVSDNASTDITPSIVQSFTDSKVHIEYYRHNQNFGYSKNVLYILSKATTDWVMLLGDDDYLDSWYIQECLNQIEKHPDLGCIIANYMGYFPATNEYGKLREENCETEYYKAGFEACLKNIWRAHQLSGLCFRRANVVEEYYNRKMDNLYPQMFFVGYNSLKYDVIHFGEKCLVVSGVLQSQKDWNYGSDGLMNDICENFKNLQMTKKQRALIEADFNRRQKRYLWACNNVNDGIDSILAAYNITLLGKYYISHQFLKENCYAGKKNRFWFYIVAKIVLIKNLLRGKIGF